MVCSERRNFCGGTSSTLETRGETSLRPEEYTGIYQGLMNVMRIAGAVRYRFTRNNGSAHHIFEAVIYLVIYTW